MVMSPLVIDRIQTLCLRSPTPKRGFTNAVRDSLNVTVSSFGKPLTMRTTVITFGLLWITACSPSTPVQDFASESGISLRYSAWDTVPTLTAQARDIAVRHCAQYGKFANYRGGNAVSPVSAEEIHQFACENEKTDDSTVIAAQSKRPDYVPVPIYQPTPVRQPNTYTNCTSVGISTNCICY